MIKVENVSMRFKKPKEQVLSLKEFTIAKLKGKIAYEEFKVFDKVSFQVKKGEVVGIIGQNGAGKSTLLKIISGVLTPTEGTVELNGKVVPMLELGSGFDFELSGRENIYLNGAILGYSEEFLKEKYNEIVEFSELQDFIETPIRNYSSGMLMRLAFSIATIVKPEILIVDEILAVGDEKFQKKSKRKMLELMSGGTTVLFVSHSIEQIREMCNRVVWLGNKSVQMIGNTKEVCDAYHEFMNPEQLEQKTKKITSDIDKYYMDVLFIFGELSDEEFEYRIHNPKEQLLAGNLCSNQIFYEYITEDILKNYRIFIFVNCPNNEFVFNIIKQVNNLNRSAILSISNNEELKKWECLELFSLIIIENEFLDIAQDFSIPIYKNRLVCSDRMEQLAEWAIYDRDILPYKNPNDMEGNMEIVNYNRAIHAHSLRKEDSLRIGCYSPDIEYLYPQLIEILEAYPNWKLYNDTFEEKNIVKTNWGKDEELSRRFAEVDIVIISIKENVDINRIGYTSLIAGLVNVPIVIYADSKILLPTLKISAEICTDILQLTNFLEKFYKTKEEYLSEYTLTNREYILKNYTTLSTGLSFAKFIQKNISKQIGIILNLNKDISFNKVLLDCAVLLKRKGVDICILNESEDDTSFSYKNMNFPIVSLKKVYVYGGFESIITNNWNSCLFFQNYSNIKNCYYLIDELPCFQPGNFERFQFSQLFNLKINIEFITFNKTIFNKIKLYNDKIYMFNNYDELLKKILEE